LYDPSSPEGFDFSSLAQIQSNIRNYAADGYAEWSRSRQELLNFISEFPSPGRTNDFSFKIVKSSFRAAVSLLGRKIKKRNVTGR
jgi:hypothetical protein